MSSRERVLCAIRRQDVDYVPCSPRFTPLYPRQRVGFTYQFPWQPSEYERQVQYCAEVLGIDPLTRLYLNTYHPEPGVTSRVWVEDGILHKEWSTPSGELHAAVRNDEKWAHGMDIPFFHDFYDHYVVPWLKTPQDIECLRHILLPAGDAQLTGIKSRFKALRELSERHRVVIQADVGLGLTGAVQAVGPLGIRTLEQEQPDLIDGYLEIEHQRNLRHIEIALDMGVHLIRRNGFYEDFAHYSRPFLERYLVPRLNAEVRLAHEGGAAVVYTLLHGVMSMLDYLVELDVDAIYGLEIFSDGIDLPLIKEKLGSKFGLWTGPSKDHHMFGDDPEAVRQAVRTTFDAFGDRGLLITSCPSVHGTMPWKNVLAMVDEWKKLR